MIDSIQLFCIPFAGGSASYYNNWQINNHGAKVVCLPVELPGRGYKYNTPFYATFDEAVANICDHITLHSNGIPCFLFGHSMGALLAYEVVRKLNDLDENIVRHLFISAVKDPSACTNQNNHLLSDDQIIERLKQYDGMPQEIYTYPELLNAILPIIRADFRLLATFDNKRDFSPLKQGVTVFGGAHDRFVSLDGLSAWEHYTLGDFALHYFDGGHFYLNERARDIIKIINETISNS